MQVGWTRVSLQVLVPVQSKFESNNQAKTRFIKPNYRTLPKIETVQVLKRSEYYYSQQQNKKQKVDTRIKTKANLNN